MNDPDVVETVKVGTVVGVDTLPLGVNVTPDVISPDLGVVGT